MAPVSSILLLVVASAARPPSSVTTPSGVTTIAPHPPGPGLPLAAPSVKTTIGAIIRAIISSLTRFFRHRRAPIVKNNPPSPPSDHIQPSCAIQRSKAQSSTAPAKRSSDSSSSTVLGNDRRYSTPLSANHCLTAPTV